METRVQDHVAYKFLYHIVWIPKYCYKLLKKGVSKYCDKVIRSVVSDNYDDIIIEELTVMSDHIHLLICIPPKYSLNKVIEKIKGSSSRIMRQKFEYLKRGRDAMWSIGYFVSSVGLKEKTIRNYVTHQQKQDSGQLKAVWDKEATGIV